MNQIAPKAHFTAIEWMVALAEAREMRAAVWNPIRGCRPASAGCLNCWAAEVADRRGRQKRPAMQELYGGLTRRNAAGKPVFNGTWRLIETGLDVPMTTRRPTAYFVGSETDLFGEGVADSWLDQAFAVMALCPRHLFVLLTKRAGRMMGYLASRNGMGNADICRAVNAIPFGIGNRHGALSMPLPNVWTGVSVENQAAANERVPDLLATPAAKRFVSAEPLLESVDISRFLDMTANGRFHASPILDWVITGADNAPADRRRKADDGWFRALRDQCAAAEVSFFLKQAYRDGRLESLPKLDGRQHVEVPS